MLLTGTPKVSFKANHAFAVTDIQGECPRLFAKASELGVYYNDTRYLDIWETLINGVASVSLAHELQDGGNSIVYSMTNRDLQKVSGAGRIPRDTFLIRRILTLVEDTFYETLELKNFSSEPQTLQIEQWLGSRFEDLFEVRGFPRKKRGFSLDPLEPSNRLTVLQYEGLDGKIRSAHIQRLFDAEKIKLTSTLAGYSAKIEVGARDTAVLKTMVSFDRLAPVVSETPGPTHEQTVNELFGKLQFESDNAIFNRALKNAELDVFMLLGKEEVPGNSQPVLYPYAGIPWFSAPFGRDGLITAYQMLPWYPEIARGVLEYVFKTMGSKFDDFTDEQPGKIFHEMRRGEMAKTREVPFVPYFGSVDSTPLALILLQEYYSWTKDLKSLRGWWPYALRALEWVEKWGDPNGDGFLEYCKTSPKGLVNQGWKDSNDSIMHADGSLAPSPISLCEVQGYAFRARTGMSSLAKIMGDGELSARLRLESLRLKNRFTEKFWDARGEYIYLALDGDLQPCAVKSSNMGHCLWGQILTPPQASAIGRHLSSDSMFNGYGIRTLSAQEKVYNPLSYHNGSVWPHDNSLIMEGFRYYGMREELDLVSSAMIGVLETTEDFRLPELFCGFRKHGDTLPIPYEVACKPQAWAAGSVFLMLKSMLGLSMEIDQNYLVFNSPLLNQKIGQLEIRGLRGPDWEMDLRVRRGKTGTSVDVLKKSGSVRVLIVK